MARRRWHDGAARQAKQHAVEVINLWPNQLVGAARLPANECWRRTHIARSQGKAWPVLAPIELGMWGLVRLVPVAP